MDITFYLVELLRLHDCVIVPDLGGFVANYRPAEMDLAHNRFSPPVKEIIFTGKLTKNDGLLVNYISETEGVGYVEARQIISEFVDEIWSNLENGEKLEFQNIGSLQFDRNEKLIFEPAIHENFLLDAFGMEGFQFPQLTNKDIISTKRIFADKDAVRPVFNSRKVRALAIGIPVLLALIFVPVSKYSSKNTLNSIFQSSSTTSIPINDRLVPSNIFKTDSATFSKVALAKIDSAASQSSIISSLAEAASVKTDARFRVIGGTFQFRENAQKFFERLQANGFKSEIKIQPNGSFLVVVQSYTNRKEAITALNTLRQAEPKTGYWLSVK